MNCLWATGEFCELDTVTATSGASILAVIQKPIVSILNFMSPCFYFSVFVNAGVSTINLNEEFIHFLTDGGYPFHVVIYYSLV